MRTVEQIVEQIRAAAGADFAFVLTRKGRLVTHRAPRDMPEEGRMRIVRAARPLVGTDKVIEVTMPREELVPFGGAAPVDVFVGVVAEQAIVCLVMASWADKLRVGPALQEGMRTIAPLLRRGLPSARRPADVEPAKGSPYLPFTMGETPKPAPSVPPAPDSAPVSAPLVELRASLLPEVPRESPRIASLPEISVSEAPLGRESLAAIRRDASTGPFAPARPSPAGGSAPDITISEAPLGRESLVAIRAESGAGPSLPEITMGEAALGRESLAAICRESGAGRSLPEITVGEAALGRESLVAVRRDAAAGGSAPEIAVSEAALGRESLAAIELDGAGRPRVASSPEGIRVDLASMPDIEITSTGDRLTMPWAEPAPEAHADRATLPWVEPVTRKLAAPKVTIKLEDADALDGAELQAPIKRS